LISIYHAQYWFLNFLGNAFSAVAIMLTSHLFTITWRHLSLINRQHMFRYIKKKLLIINIWHNLYPYKWCTISILTLPRFNIVFSIENYIYYMNSLISKGHAIMIIRLTSAFIVMLLSELSWSWSYGNWIYNYCETKA
jgi:hypothetical protein